MPAILLLLCLFAASTRLAANELTVYTYDSFVSQWGPGKEIQTAFEAQCNCELKWVALGDALGILGRLRLEGEDSRADVVLGLDHNMLADARNTGLFADPEFDMAEMQLPIDWQDDLFIPYDYGYFAFVYRDGLPDVPRSLDALVYESDASVLIQDPRSSSPGLGLLLWLRQHFGEDSTNAWQSLAPRIVSVTKGWSQAYGMFLNGEADMVLSYTSSPAYHRHAGDETDIRAALFEEGHYLQVEVAAMLKHSRQPELARQFLRFIHSDAFQDRIPTGNWMYPVVETEAGLPPVMAEQPRPQALPLIDSDQVQKQRRQWIRDWQSALSQ